MLINVNNINSSYELLRRSNPAYDLERELEGRKLYTLSLALPENLHAVLSRSLFVTSSKLPSHSNVCILVLGSQKILH